MSGLGRYIVDAVVLDHRSPTALAQAHGISRRWIYKLLERYREGGYAALEPRSRRPHSSATKTCPEVEAEVIQLRTELGEAGHGAGPPTLPCPLAERPPAPPPRCPPRRPPPRQVAPGA